MVAQPPTWGEVTANGWNFSSILMAIKRCLIAAGFTGNLGMYDPNFEGITRALFDLSSQLQGRYPQTTIYDPSITINPPALVDGSFVFDTRQGRLFVVIGGEWYQTNGAESLVHIGAQPPADPISGRELKREGQLWLSESDGRFYVYVDDPSALGDPGWYEVPVTLPQGATAGSVTVQAQTPATAGGQGGVPVSSMPPPAPAPGMLWVDVRGPRPDLKLYDGQQWLAAVEGAGPLEDVVDPHDPRYSVLGLGLMDEGVI